MRPARTWRLCLSQSIPQICLTPKPEFMLRVTIYQKALEDLIRTQEIRVRTLETGRRLDGNYKQRGKDWERAAHVDYFESDGKTTVCRLQQDCGIRIQGNYSRSDLPEGLALVWRKKYGKKISPIRFLAIRMWMTGS